MQPSDVQNLPICLQEIPLMHKSPKHHLRLHLCAWNRPQTLILCDHHKQEPPARLPVSPCLRARATGLGCLFTQPRSAPLSGPALEPPHSKWTKSFLSSGRDERTDSWRRLGRRVKSAHWWWSGRQKWRGAGKKKRWVRMETEERGASLIAVSPFR